MTDAPLATGPARFRDQAIAFDGRAGRNIDIPSASPLNYHQVVSKPADMPPVTIDGKLFLPAATGVTKLPLVMIVPGSLRGAVACRACRDADPRRICQLRPRQFWRARRHLDGRQPNPILLCRQRL